MFYCVLNLRRCLQVMTSTFKILWCIYTCTFYTTLTYFICYIELLITNLFTLIKHLLKLFSGVFIGTVPLMKIIFCPQIQGCLFSYTRQKNMCLLTKFYSSMIKSLVTNFNTLYLSLRWKWTLRCITKRHCDCTAAWRGWQNNMAHAN